jgi:hypothetical protein
VLKLLKELNKAGITSAQIIRAVRMSESRESETPPVIGPTPAMIDGASVVIVEVNGDAGGGGVYEGIYALAGPLAEDLDAGGNAEEAHFGNFTPPSNISEAGECYVFNMAEEGQSTHDLTDGGQTIKRFLGVFLGYEKNDGKPCFGINGFDVTNCTS